MLDEYFFSFILYIYYIMLLKPFSKLFLLRIYVYVFKKNPGLYQKATQLVIEFSTGTHPDSIYF